jgi:hypothetical protein
LIDQLAGHPLFSNARRLGEAELADYDPAILKPALREIGVLHASGRSWPWPPTGLVAERLAALLAAHSASHLLVLGEQPLDLLLVTVPVVSADPRPRRRWRWCAACWWPLRARFRHDRDHQQRPQGRLRRHG